MNVFRAAGDLSHVISIFILLLRLISTKQATGISLKTQELFLVVFLCRYLDLFTSFISWYNTIMKILYICSTGYIVYMIRYKEPYRSKYDVSQDSFLHVKLGMAPCMGLAMLTMLFQWSFDLFDLLWVFSIYLEAIAILPQLIVLQRYREVENLDGHYIFFLGAYRALYILNWIYRSYYEKHYHHNWPGYIAGACQTALYVDFFYYYIISKYYGGKLTLPS